MIFLSPHQTAYILHHFASECGEPQAHQNVWLRRSYAPMLIHTATLTSVRDIVMQMYPQHVICFDVIFESAGGLVDWHCDYESLGPFSVPIRRRAVGESHFLSVHFNLTANGGSLTTLDWVWLSLLHYWCISTFGIFSTPHRVLNAISRPFYRCFARVFPNVAGWGNVFDNTRLHSVSPGERRISYVLRLAKKDCVTLSRTSVLDGMQRSKACAVFERLLDRVSDDPLDVASLDWANLKKPAVD